MSRKNKHSVPAGSKQWVHPNEALLRGHIVYNTKFLGTVKVDEPKGTEVVKDAIRKMKFNKQIKKAEGVKSPKVELTISVDGVTVQEPKYKVIQHQYPLHRISYCADDKSDKRMFTFIAKAADSNQHHCFVFDSEKCAEEITLTIGQAFDLAYKRFLDTAGRDMDMRKQVLLSQKKIQHLTEENLQLKAQVADLERLIDPKVLETYDRMKKEKQQPSSTSQDAVVGRKLENLVFDDDKNVDNSGAEKHSNGNVASSPVYSTPAPPARAAPAQPAAAANSPLPRLAPPPPVPARNNIPTSPTGNQPPPSAPGAAPTARQGQQGVDLFGAEPFVPPTTNGTGGAAATDAFGMPSFSAVSSAPQSDLDRQIQNVDQELMDLQTGFSQGLSYGTEDFSLDDLDPLKK